LSSMRQKRKHSNCQKYYDTAIILEHLALLLFN
jgi:hypothetical protein